MQQQTRVALLKMGYRKMHGANGEVFMKIIGYSLFIYYPDQNKLYQKFKGANQEILVMESWEIDEEHPLRCIKEAENYHHQVAALDSSFEFLTVQESAELAMEGIDAMQEVS